MLGGQFGLDLGIPNQDADLVDEMKQWAFSLQAGALF
jgi:hypothetical protein